MKRNLAMAFMVMATTFFVSFVFFVPTHAQTAAPQFLISWKASGSYLPSFYQGKALPSYGSKVTASLEIISNGKALNLKNQTIYWYLNDTLIGGGAGVQRVTFQPFDVPPTSQTLKIELPNYNGNFLIHTVQIPTVQPEAVIYAPYPDGQVSTSQIPVSALVYFFNTSSPANLSFDWTVNGQAGSGTENPDQANINLPADTPSGTNFSVSLTVKNPLDSTVAAATTNLIYQKQL